MEFIARKCPEVKPRLRWKRTKERKEMQLLKRKWKNYLEVPRKCPLRRHNKVPEEKLEKRYTRKSLQFRSKKMLVSAGTATGRKISRDVAVVRKLGTVAGSVRRWTGPDTGGFVRGPSMSRKGRGRQRRRTRIKTSITRKLTKLDPKIAVDIIFIY